MTQHEELSYLYDIVSEANKWTLTDVNQNAIALEVDHRIKCLLSELSPQQPLAKSSVCCARTRARPAATVAGLSFNQFKYRMRGQLKDLTDEEVRAKYDEYLEHSQDT